jgi:hypothetical protein
MAKKRKKPVPAPVADYDETKSKVRQAARIISEAKEIQEDKEFMKKVRAEQKEQMKILKKAMR